MPHLRLEYSGNIELSGDRFKRLFSRLHDVLADQAAADLNRCQGRAIRFEDFYVGDGAETRAFVYLQAILLEGRSAHQLQETGRGLLKVLQEEFKDLLIHYNAQISVHINEIPSDRSHKSNHYFKSES